MTGDKRVRCEKKADITRNYSNILEYSIEENQILREFKDENLDTIQDIIPTSPTILTLNAREMSLNNANYTVENLQLNYTIQFDSPSH